MCDAGPQVSYGEHEGGAVAGQLGGRSVRVHLSIDADELPTEAAAVREVLELQHLDVSQREGAGSDVHDADVFVGVYGDRYGDIDPASASHGSKPTTSPPGHGPAWST